MPKINKILDIYESETGGGIGVRDRACTDAGITDDDEYEDLCYDNADVPAKQDGHIRYCKNRMCGISFHSTHVDDKCPACGMSQISEYSHGDAYDGHFTPPTEKVVAPKRCIAWIPFDKNNMPPDGSYIARIIICGRVDNPGYNKLRVLNGYCPDEIASITTHYAIDPGID